MILRLFELIIISNLFSGSRTSAVNGNVQISNAFESIGYTPACVSSALTSCELSPKKDLSVNLIDLFEIIKSLPQEIKSQRENFLTEIKTLRQELKLEREKAKQNSDSLWNKLENVTQTLSNVEAILQEMNGGGSSPKNCASTVDNFTDIGASAAEVKPSLPTPNISVEEKPKITYWKNCAELKLTGNSISGVQTVYPFGDDNPKPVEVYCDQLLDGGGWTVIQNRDYQSFRQNFTRPWQQYVEGFGDLNGELWLGLENIHALTTSSQMELRVDLQDESDEEVDVDDSYEVAALTDEEAGKRWAKYEIFHVGDAASKYVLRVGNYYAGDAGDGLTHESNNLNGMKFTTYDEENDLWTQGNCAEVYLGGWWFNNCFYAHLNGLPHKGSFAASNPEGIIWRPFRGWYYSMKRASMKIRPKS